MDWFETSKDKIQPRIDTVTSLLKQLRECKDEHTKSCLQEELKLANKIRNIIISEAKESYMSKLAEKLQDWLGQTAKLHGKQYVNAN
jgi:hypothetical protein